MFVWRGRKSILVDEVRRLPQYCPNNRWNCLAREGIVRVLGRLDKGRCFRDVRVSSNFDVNNRPIFVTSPAARGSRDKSALYGNCWCRSALLAAKVWLHMTVWSSQKFGENCPARCYRVDAVDMQTPARVFENWLGRRTQNVFVRVARIFRCCAVWIVCRSVTEFSLSSRKRGQQYRKLFLCGFFHYCLSSPQKNLVQFFCNSSARLFFSKLLFCLLFETLAQFSFICWWRKAAKECAK